MPFETPERMNQDVAHDEAKKLQDKVENVLASDYDSAERAINRENKDEAQKMAVARITLELNSNAEEEPYEVFNQKAIKVKDGKMTGHIYALGIRFQGEGSIYESKVITSIVQALIKDGVKVFTDGSRYYVEDKSSEVDFPDQKYHELYASSFGMQDSSTSVFADGTFNDYVDEDEDRTPFLKVGRNRTRQELTLVESL